MDRTRSAGSGDWPAVELRAGRVILLSGASGSGKSTLLRRLRRRHRGRATWVDLNAVRLPRGRAVIDVMCEAIGGGADDGSIVAALEALSRVGLGEVWTYLRTVGQISEGQRWRLRLAVAMARGEGNPGSKPPGLLGDSCVEGGRGDGLVVLVADEFGAVLDRVTAMVVARALRKGVSGRSDVCAVVATSHADVTEALSPDVVVSCDFGSVQVEERRLS
jgi:ABC-type ATPase with predicted acetyltransferase domain